MKRKNTAPHNEGRIKKSDFTVKSFVPFSGPRPIFKCILHKVGRDKIDVPIRVLFDSGSSIAMISRSVILEFNIPKVQRDVPRAVLDYAGSAVAGVGEAYSFPLLLKIKNHFSKETFEIADLDNDYDAILPWWWIVKHRPGNWYAGDVSFESSKCKNNCTLTNANSFSIIYDERILEYADQSGTIGSISLATDDSPEVALQKVWEVIPQDYWQYAKAFTERQSAQLPPHRSYDHKIDLLPGQQPPWGPIYALSKEELRTLQEYIEDMLKTGKIRKFHSPAGVPIFFVPKDHGQGLRLVVNMDVKQVIN